jgi:hypothetical protein
MDCTFCLCPAISFFWFISARISAMFWVVITFVALTVIGALSGLRHRGRQVVQTMEASNETAQWWTDDPFHGGGADGDGDVPLLGVAHVNRLQRHEWPASIADRRRDISAGRHRAWRRRLVWRVVTTLAENSSSTA